MTLEHPRRARPTIRRTPDGPSDAVLIDQVRGGDRAAFELLWKRHHSAAMSFARTLVPPDDVADVVAEAMTAVWGATHRGGGPDAEFRPYLFRAVRTAAIASTRRRHRAPLPVDDLARLESVALNHEDPGVERVARAFAALAPEAQEVLWYSIVDGESARSVATITGLSLQAVYARISRSRRALRASYLNVVANDVVAAECRTAVPLLGSYAAGRLDRKRRAEVRSHLASCASCGVALVELHRLDERLPAVLPIMIGGLAPSFTTVPLAGSVAVGVTMSAGLTGILGAGAVVVAAAVTAVVVWPNITPEPPSDPVAIVSVASNGPSGADVDPVPAPTAGATEPAATDVPDEPTTSPTSTPSVGPSTGPSTPSPTTSSPTTPSPSRTGPSATSSTEPTSAPTAAPPPTAQALPPVTVATSLAEDGTWIFDISGCPPGSQVTLVDGTTGRTFSVVAPSGVARIRSWIVTGEATTPVTVSASVDGGDVARSTLDVASR